MIAVLLVAGLALEVEVGRLGAPQPAVRRHARAALVAAGEKAIPALHRGLRADDPEVRRGAAALLDHFLDKSLQGRRNNPAYSIPRNKVTEQLKRWPVARLNILGQRRFLEHFAGNYRGVLARWSQPTLADYNGLLRSLSLQVKHTTRAGHEGLRAVFAVHAITTQLVRYRPGLDRNHWTTRWLVRRELLPALRQTVRGHGAGLSVAEVRLFRQICGHITDLCDEESARIRRRLVVRLPQASE
ncbi:MAG: hypothetical protein ACYS0K_11635 [Planctomycetota bacterium]|jgi:hypothetical protein